MGGAAAAEAGRTAGVGSISEEQGPACEEVPQGEKMEQESPG